MPCIPGIRDGGDRFDRFLRLSQSLLFAPGATMLGGQRATGRSRSRTSPDIDLSPVPSQYRSVQVEAARTPSVSEMESADLRPATVCWRTTTGGLSDEQVFRAIFGEPKSKTRRKWLAMLIDFAEVNALGPLASITDFLSFVDETVKAHGYRHSWVFTKLDLRCWFAEYQDGRPQGSKR